MDAPCQAHPEHLASGTCTRCDDSLCLTCLLGAPSPHAPLCARCLGAATHDDRGELDDGLRTTGLLRALYALATGALCAVIVHPRCGDVLSTTLLAAACVAVPLWISAALVLRARRAWCVWTGVALDAVVAAGVVMLAGDASTLVFLGMPFASGVQAARVQALLAV